MEQEEQQSCFECLKRRIISDFSDKLIFSYALSDSAFPFASSAVVQVPNSNGNPSTSASASASQFVLVQLPSHKHNCLIEYINESVLQDNEESDGYVNGGNQDQEKVNDLTGPATSDSSIDQSPCLQNGDKIANVNQTGFGSSTCAHSSRFGCVRTIPALAPTAHIGNSSYPNLQKIASDFLSGSLEDHVLRSLSLLIEGKASGRDGVNFLRLIGLPSFEESGIPGCLRHPNIIPVLGLLKTSEHVNLVLPKTPCTLEGILHYCPKALKSEWHIRFLAYQLLSALVYLHGLGVSHGNIHPSNVMLTNSCWSWLRICDKPISGSNVNSRKGESDTTASARLCCCTDRCFSQVLYADLKLSPSVEWHSQFDQWWKGELSNFEYLLVLNRLAGRRWGDHTFHTVMPWVVDFSTKPDENSDSGWRDLSKSKWRLAKGDEQLDFTFSTSEIPHHVSDECLSELAVCSYKARRLPLSVLRLAVRSVYEPNEYPSNMQRLYQWTPDECIPEFYCDPQIFYSLQPGMSDLAVPPWAGSAEEFIKLHRDALESERVSRQIHHWIDITFGYKMSGQAAVSAKNVMLPSSDTAMPRSVGRRQLFTRPHPVRRVVFRKKHDSANTSMNQSQLNVAENDISLLSETVHLQQLEEVTAFAEHAGYLSPCYYYNPEKFAQDVPSVKELARETFEKSICKPLEMSRNHRMPCDINLSYLLEHIEVEGKGSLGYQELLLWRQKSSCSRALSEDFAKDIFSVGCVLAELHLKRPLFNSTSLASYIQSGISPGSMQELPPHTKVLVEACIQKDWARRPSAKSILESPYFPATVKSAYLFIAPLQLLANDGPRLQYAANFAKQGALKAMGTLAAEMCAPYCLPLVVSPLSDIEAEWAYVMLKEFLKCLTPKAVKDLILPAIQKILQTTGYSHLKVSLLQGSFMQEIWNFIGKQAYLETVHPLVISNLCIAPHRSSAAVASVLLIGTSEELGVPITVNQTILPLIYCFGKGLCPDGIDVLVRLGGLFGETFIIRQLLPLLKQVARSCVNVSNTTKPEPIQSWSALALLDCLTTLDGLVALLPREVVAKELFEDRSLHVMVLTQTNLEISVVQVAANALIAACQRIGPDLTALHVLPQLKELFDELAFSQEAPAGSGSFGRNLKISRSKVDGEAQIGSRMDLVLLLYPYFASLLGTEKLRKGCATWLLLEQYLLRYHNWKWECTGDSPRSGAENITAKRPSLNKGSTSDYNPAKLLLNGVGWSIPQSQGIKGAKNLMPQKRFDGIHQRPVEGHAATSNLLKSEPWFWFPSPAASWDGPDFLGRVGSLKEEFPWKIRASVIYSIRAHHGALRSLSVSQDECTVFTAGTGPGFKGTVQKWELSRINCVSGYYGHEEVVNDICALSSSGRIASSDGTIHVWNSITGKVVSVFSEPSIYSAHISSPSSQSKTNDHHPSMLNSNTLSSGLWTSAFDGSLYTCMHYLESLERLVVGTGNGSLRFIDASQGQKLHLWRGESADLSFPSLVSAICSCGSDKTPVDGAHAPPSWVAAGLSSGHCRLFDLRSGNVIASWRAHDGYVTKLAAPEDYLLVSSSLDKTLRVWDLRRSWPPPQPSVLRGHTDGVSGFSIWGQDIISISRNKIGLSTLSRFTEEDGQQRITPQKLYAADNGTKNVSVLSSISILPFSRLFVVGTEDGYLRICC
ncbi:inactive serine/threonine-protein kinase lvsG [Salix suchowensis]|nr:inactive serine/threonine-protein kinase lvsG [Salix suchowensis]